MKEIKTERLLLRKWSVDDADSCYKYARNPNVGPHAGWKPHESVEESKEIIEVVFLASTAWAVIEQESGELIGCIGLEPDKKRPGIASREVGYWMAEEFWGRGYITEAARAVMEYAFIELELDILAICTGPLNKRSQRVIEKCGFKYEGVLRKSYKIYDGSIRDTLCYSLKREEWKGE